MDERILIVFDLDETLIHSTLNESDRPADFMFREHYVYVRPHLNTFFKKSNEHFDFAIWTNGGEAYTCDILKKIIPSFIGLRFVWPKSMFVNGVPQTLDTLRAPKNLRRLIVNGFEPSKVLIVDDNPDDSVIEFGNVIQLHPYRGQTDDCELLLLLKYLEKVLFLKDTRSIKHVSWRTEVS
jgi:RNA polymerase II subunit A small phosphatase-like protein